MQYSALATTRPVKNRLFALSLDLQEIIYGYVDWEEYHDAIYENRRNVFKLYRQDILRDPLYYYWSCNYNTVIMRIPTIIHAPGHFCGLCEYPMFRKMLGHRISNIDRIFDIRDIYYPRVCSEMCRQLDDIRYRADYDEYEPCTPEYTEKYAKIYKEHFEDPKHKRDKDEYERLLIIDPDAPLRRELL